MATPDFTHYTLSARAERQRVRLRLSDVDVRLALHEPEEAMLLPNGAGYQLQYGTLLLMTRTRTRTVIAVWRNRPDYRPIDPVIEMYSQAAQQEPRPRA